MHEMSIAESTLQLIEDAARQQKFGRVKTIVLELGELSSIERDSLLFCFEIIARGTLADGAQLRVLDVPGSGWCPQCRQEAPMHDLYTACPTCGGYRMEVRCGTEMRIKELEVE